MSDLHVVALGSGAWGVDTVGTPDGYIVALGGGGYGVDTTATSGARITATGGAYTFAFDAATSGRGKRRTPLWIDVQRDRFGNVINIVTNGPFL